ncbi:hypothetical protein B0H14DRAFT_3161067 [Mycena olivaceomarginata]|nr:hypothetical protein B0H14DRAFT_3161067 [Mycena olivaceomarginata]
MKNIKRKASKELPTAETNDRTKISNAGKSKRRTVEAALSRTDVWRLTKPSLVQILQSRGRPFLKTDTVPKLRDQVFLMLESDRMVRTRPARRRNVELVDDVFGLKPSVESEKTASRRKKVTVQALEDFVDPAPKAESRQREVMPRRPAVREVQSCPNDAYTSHGVTANSPIPKKLSNEAIQGQALKLESSTSAEDQVPKVGRPRRGINTARADLPRDVETRRNAIPKLIIIKSVMELDAVLQVKRGHNGYLTIASLNAQLDWHAENPVSETADPQNTSASGIPGVKRRGRRDDHIEYLRKAIQSRFDILQNARDSSIASD